MPLAICICIVTELFCCFHAYCLLITFAVISLPPLFSLRRHIDYYHADFHAIIAGFHITLPLLLICRFADDAD